jgi:20S proteasome alpha/beta subunit
LLSEFEEQQNFIQESIPNQEDLLTTVIGIKWKDGVVIGTDSQFTDRPTGTKSLIENKIFRINDFMILGGAGNPSQTNILVESLQENLENNLYTDKELRKIIMKNILAPLHKDYNVELSHNIGLKETRLSFYPSSLIGAKLAENFGLYRIDLPYIYPITGYEVIGSGHVLAHFLFKLNNRWLDIAGEKWSDRRVSQTEKTCGYMINEIKESDLYTGGKIRVTSISCNGMHELSDVDITNLSLDFASSFVELMSEIGKHPQEFIETFMKSMSKG